MALIEISVLNFEGNYLSKSGETQIKSCIICNGDIAFFSSSIWKNDFFAQSPHPT